MYTRATIFALIILLSLSLIVNVKFYNHYVKPLKYPCKYYADVKFRTGDLLLFRSSSSAYLWITNEEFSHVGIVLEINNHPYCLELQPPNAKLTPIYERLDKYKNGVVCVKQLNHALSDDPNINLPGCIDDVLQFAKQVAYPDTFAKTGAVYAKSRFIDPWKIRSVDDFMCSKFVLHVLKKLSILQGNERISKITDWLSRLSSLVRSPYKYGRTLQLTFFDEEDLETNRDFWSVENFMRNLYGIG